MRGWPNESQRHGLAARGIKTKIKPASKKPSVGTRTATIVDQWSWNEIMDYLKDTHGRYDYVIFTNPDNGKECLISPKKF